MFRFLIRARFVSFLLVLLALGLLLAFGRHVEYEQSVQSFFSEDDPAVIAFQEASASFGNDNVVFICYDDPELLTPGGMARVAELAGALAPGEIEAVVGVESLDAMPALWMVDDRLVALEKLPGFLKAAAVKAARGLVQNLDMTIGRQIQGASDAEALAAIREKVTSHPLLRGTLVNAEGTSTAVVVRLAGMAEQDPKATVARLRAEADAFAARHGLGRPALVGPPVLLADGFSAIERDGQRLALAGMALIGLVTLTATRSLWWSIVPILAGWVVWRAAEQVMWMLGLKLSLSGGPLVAQIIVLTMPAASHLAIHFRDELRSGADDRRESARKAMRFVATPIVWCAVTGALGYGALLTSNVVPVRQFGVVLAVCTLVASLLTLAISPLAMLPPFPLEVPVRPGSSSRVERSLNGLTGWVYRHPAPIVLGTILIVAPLLLGIFRLSYESNYINAFQPDTRVVRDYHFVESRLGGIGVVSVVVPLGETIAMDDLARFRALDEQLRAIGRDDARGLTPVANVVSLATVLDPDGKLAALGPEKGADALKTKLDLIAASAQGDLLKGFWNPGTGWARTLVRVPEQQEARAKEATFARAESLARATFGDRSYLTGLSYLLTQTTRGVIETQWTTFTWSAVSIFLMLTLAFRSATLAVLAILPTMLSVGFVLGLMGWTGVKLDVATALVASVALGLSVDDTFHCLLQFRRHRAEKETFRESLFASYSVTGPGVLLSSLAVAIGFAVLRFSEFVPFSHFGLMVGIATLGSSLGNLVLLPACLTLGRRLRDRLAPAPAAEAVDA